MKKKTNKYTYEFANYNDGKELVSLLEEASFDGDYTLIYTKRPNAYESVEKDAKQFAIAIGRNTTTNEICGMGICTINKLLLDGQKNNIAYLSGFRRKKNIGGDISQVYKIFQNFCKDNNVKYTYTTILEDNISAQKLLTKKRKLLPHYIKIADYTVNIFKAKLQTNHLYNCTKAQENDLEKLKKFIENESKKKTFFPYLDLDKEFFGLNYKDFYLLKNSKNEILACGILWNQTDYKQLIVKNYSFKYQLIRKLANLVLGILNYPLLPKINEIVDYSTLSFVLYKDDNEEYLNHFIREISHHVKEKLFVYASTKELNENITPMKYKSFVYIVDWDKNFDNNSFNNKNLYIECGLL